MRWVGRTELNTGVWWGYLWESGYFEDIGEDERIIMKCIFKTRDGIDLADDTDRCRELVYATMDIRVP